MLVNYTTGGAIELRWETNADLTTYYFGIIENSGDWEMVTEDTTENLLFEVYLCD